MRIIVVGLPFFSLILMNYCFSLISFSFLFFQYVMITHSLVFVLNTLGFFLLVDKKTVAAKQQKNGGFLIKSDN